MLTAGVALLPEASAQCEPMPVLSPDYCDGDLPRIPPECWWDAHGIHCRMG